MLLKGDGMLEYFIGIDSGTQSTKAVLFDAATGKIIASASKQYELIEGLSTGHKEQNPSDWIDAVHSTIKTILDESNIDRSLVRGIGVSGQQHGFVPLDINNNVIRPAKLWCDTSTDAECKEIISALGGEAKTIEALGNGVPTGFTASKVLWLKKHEPTNYSKLAFVLLPHDYINLYLTGNKTMECGDASGTALFDVQNRRWSQKAIDAIDPQLKDKLPPLISSDDISGTLRPVLAVEFGLSKDVIVSSGGGDNMIGAIGTGNVSTGIVTVSLGTSGTIYSCSDKPVIDTKGEIAAFCDSTGKWLPLVCTMNVTVATEMVRHRFNLSHDQLSEAASSVKAGNNGLMLLPFFEGERTPNIPNGTGVYFGLRNDTYTIPHFARAAMEGTTFGLNYGLNRMRELGIKPREIRATGGGAKSKVWCQILADIFYAEVVCMNNEEGAAFGAALQALWAYRINTGKSETIENICNQYVSTDETTRVKPDYENVIEYQRMQRINDRLVGDLGGAFDLHRDLIMDL